MDKKKTSKKPRQSCPKEVEIKDFSGLKEWSPETRLLNKTFVLEAITECLLSGDHEGAVEVFLIHVKAVNRSKLSRDSHVPRSTIEHGLLQGNTTVKTAFRLLSAW